jgi:superfamily I DNA and/or RNA helicase
VNEFVKQLFEIWKLNWQKIQKIERKFMMSSIQRKMMKRANDQNDERQKKIRDLV